MKTIVGVMGGGENSLDIDKNNAYEIGKYIASIGFITLSLGRNVGVMNEALRGAKENGGITLGILPNDDVNSFSKYIDIPVITNMRSGRNYINALTSNIIVACGVELGTSSEISLGLKAGKNVILLGAMKEAKDYNNAIKIIDNLI